MSRKIAVGINPQTNDVVDIAYGWDEVPGFKPGYFFQVYSRRKTSKKMVRVLLLMRDF